MTPGEFLEKAKKIWFEDREWDTENQHIDSDDLMYRVLRELGYGEGVDFISKQEKWYA
jgi:uncharacterized protein (DUF2267 family)